MTVEDDEEIDWPSVSVIMPALNEEELIEKSIDSIFSSRYPQHKVEVICINDGSTDLTLINMRKAEEKYGDRLKVISFKRNLGKRKALYSGLKKSRGDIIITVDTDSRIGRTAIKNVVIPLIKDKRTGAVSGRVEVLNERQNFLTRMLAIRYSISFNFGRAYQSVYGCVFCCPGALTAYRRNLLLRFIKDWVNQKFLNTPCTYGEDRSLTTQILRAGYMTRFQSNALVYTKAPSKFGKMNRMYLRWTRSYIRESIIFSQFMFTKYRHKSRILPILDFFFLNFLHPFHIIALALVIYSFFINPLFILRQVAFLVILSFFLSLYYLRAKKSLTFLYGIPYAIITAFCLWWIVPYAAATLKNQSWMTR
jgi:hyaluronan synthase